VTHPLVAALTSRDAGERARACRLAVDDPSAVVLLESLAGALGDPVPRVAMAAADAFASIGARDGEGDERLRRALRRGPPNARWAATFAAAQLAPPSPRSLPPLVEALTCDDPAIQWRATRLLVEAASVLPEVEPMLTNLAIAPDADPRVRRMAVHALRLLAPGSGDTEHTCLIAADDPDPRVRRAAASALAGCSGKAAGLRLLEMAEKDPDETSAQLAISALLARGDRDPESRPPSTSSVLRRITEGKAPTARRDIARRALERLRDEAEHG